MLTLSKYEGKTEEEAKEKCINDLNISEEEIFFKKTVILKITLDRLKNIYYYTFGCIYYK